MSFARCRTCKCGSLSPCSDCAQILGTRPSFAPLKSSTCTSVSMLPSWRTASSLRSLWCSWSVSTPSVRLLSFAIAWSVISLVRELVLSPQQTSSPPCFTAPRIESFPVMLLLCPVCISLEGSFLFSRGLRLLQPPGVWQWFPEPLWGCSGARQCVGECHLHWFSWYSLWWEAENQQKLQLLRHHHLVRQQVRSYSLIVRCPQAGYFWWDEGSHWGFEGICCLRCSIRRATMIRSALFWTRPIPSTSSSWWECMCSNRILLILPLVMVLWCGLWLVWSALLRSFVSTSVPSGISPSALTTSRTSSSWSKLICLLIWEVCPPTASFVRYVRLCFLPIPRSMISFVVLVWTSATLWFSPTFVIRCPRCSVRYVSLLLVHFVAKETARVAG